jgi:exo-rhamnogalacturonan lyase-like protein
VTTRSWSRRCRAKGVALALTMALIAASPALAALPVPIAVQEVLPAGVSGVARTGEPVTVGIPLEESQGITSVSQLGLSGATAGQFRELARWPGGALKWVLVDFQSDLPAGGTTASVSLTSGTGNFGGPDLATDQGSSIAVSTGAATFTVKKSPFRLFDQVSVGATPLVSAGDEGVVVVDTLGVRYSSANDTGALVSIEENGPLRTVIRAYGSLRNASGTRLCDYLVRLHFYRGKSYVRAWVSLRNAREANPTSFWFKNAEVVVPIVPGSGLHFTTETTRGTVSDALASSETAYLYQAYSSQNGSYLWDNAPMVLSGTTFAQNGVEVRKVGGTIYQALTGNPADYAKGWASLEDGTGRGLTVGMRWMCAMWPAGFEFSGAGAARVELFSKRNSKTAIKFAWGAYDTRELLFDFHASAPASRNTALYELQYPLGGRAPLTQYAAAGAIFGEKNLVSANDQLRWFTAHGSTSPSLANITPAFLRYYAFSMAGGGNQMDFELADLLDWLRTGNGGFLDNADQRTLYKADNAVRHSDGFDWTQDQIDTGDQLGGENKGSYNGQLFDFEHPHWISIPIAYFVTGNELFHEAAIDYGEWKHGMGDGSPPNYYLPLQIFGDGGMRGWSRYYRDFALLWDVTRDPRYWSDLDIMTTATLNSRDTPGSALPAGRNLQRGYMWQSWNGYVLPRLDSDFITVQIHFEAMWEGLRLLREANDPRAAAMEDYLFGLADFIYNEFYFDVGTAQGQYGYVYAYYLDQVNDAANPYWSQGFRPISSARAMTLAFNLTGDAKYLTRASKLLCGDINYVSPRTPTDPASECFMQTDLYRPVTGWYTVPGVTTQNIGNGAYTLSWTVPAGTTGYRIKAANQTIVPWLGFNQATRAYQFDPSSYVAWFAANDAPGAPPVPLAPGSTQSVTVSGLDPTKSWNFAIRYQTTVVDNTPPAPVSNLIAR